MQGWKRTSSRALLGLAILALGAPALFAGAPKRIVSVAPAFTEILYALGLGSEVIGTTSYCDYPPEARNTAKIGDSMTPNVEKILALRPDVIFCGAYKWELPKKLRTAGVRVVEIPDAVNLESVFANILLIGKETDRRQKASDIVKSMKATIEQVRRRFTAAASPPRVYMEIDAGNWTIGRTSYIHEALEIAGLKNIFADRTEPYMLVTMEAIVSRNPDLILSSARASAEFRRNPAWQAVPAVQYNRIVGKEAMDWNSIVRPGPRIAEGISRLAVLAHAQIGARASSPREQTTCAAARAGMPALQPWDKNE